MEWPPEFFAWRSGAGCPSCAEGRPGATRSGVRFYKGECCDAYLVRADIQRGLTVALFRGRHVAEPTEPPIGRRRATAGRCWRSVVRSSAPSRP